MFFGVEKSEIIPRMLSRSSIGISDLEQSLSINSGRIDSSKLTLFSIVRDEMYFMPAFLNHYRSIGIQQFLILDDGSIDGTFEFLKQQADCVVIKSTFAYGDEKNVPNSSRKRRRDRAGVLMKNIVPNKLLPNQPILYVDADEFLFLPPSLNTVGDIVENLFSSKEHGVAASVVEFFPENISSLFADLCPPETLQDLLGKCPFFEARPVIKLRRGQQPEIIGPSKSMLMMNQVLPQGLVRRLVCKANDALGIKNQAYGNSPRLKTPIILQSKDVFRKSSHRANVAPADGKLLTVAHFVFTPNLPHKVKRAMQWRSHAGSGAKYFEYQRLLQKMRAGNMSFLGPDSQRFESAHQFLDAGLMEWGTLHAINSPSPKTPDN